MVEAGQIGSTRFRMPGALGRLGPLAAALVLVVQALLASPLTAVAASGDVGYQDQSYSGTSDPTGTKRAESILWFNDGSWWASMWHTTSSDFHIFRLDLMTQTWVDTGVPLDLRADTHADVLWDGTKLYVASHRFVDDEQNAQSGFPSYLYRFSYVAATKTYSLDAGFPVQINNMKTETLVIDKDSTGKLWATWSQNNTIYMNRTLNGDDRTWGTPFALPIATATNLTIDDNSAVVAFGGNSIGVMWSNQTTANDAMWFAVHLDGDPETTWQAARTAIQGPNSADDHMNLKTLTTDTAGRVYAAIKTSFNNAAQPQIMLLVRDPSSGNWSSHAISRVSNCPNRVIVLVDEENRDLHAFFTAPGPPNYSCNSSGGAIYTKSSPLDAIDFPVGSGTVVIQDADSPVVHNVTSTKQNVSSATGIALLARNSSTKRYWHAYLPIAPSTPPPPVASFSGSPRSGTTPLNVAFTDTSTGSPTSWSWDFGDGTTSTTQHPTKTYSAAGTYTVALTVSNAAGSDTRTEVAYISVTSPPPPVASFSGSPRSGTTPLNVAFTDTSTGSPTSWSWDFGDGTTSTTQHPTKTYSAAGTYTVALTVSNAAGSDTRTEVAYVSVTSPPPPVASFSGSPRSGTTPLNVAFTDTSTGSPTSWSWDFGDGTTSTTQHPTKTYSAAGTYTVALTVSNAAGSDTRTEVAYVSVTSPPPPVASFSGSPRSGTTPLNVAFTDTSTGSPTSWSWDFGDGTTSTTQHPTKTYSAAGTYTVALTVSNAAGSDTRTEVAYISITSPPPPATIRRESVRTTVNATATTTVVIATPAGTAAGDVLVACVVPNATKVASTGVPAGWVGIAAVIQGTSTRAYGYYKVAGSSEPISYTWTLNTSAKNAGGIARYSGVDTATPLDATPRSASGTTATMGTVPAVTTSSANAMLVGCMGIDSSSTGVGITSPTGMTEAWDIGGKRHELADGIQTTPGSSGVKTWTFSSGREWAGWLVALRPR